MKRSFPLRTTGTDRRSGSGAHPGDWEVPWPLGGQANAGVFSRPGGDKVCVSARTHRVGEHGVFDPAIGGPRSAITLYPGPLICLVVTAQTGAQQVCGPKADPAATSRVCVDDVEVKRPKD